MLKIILYIIFFFISFVSFSQKDDQRKISVNEYLDAYKSIAIKEMERSGIPASITLAQGIHESGFGNSELSRKSNNHFGIKCGNNWKGKKYYKWDDDPQKSCFRVYKSANDSYVDHTDFLLNRKRYAFLFEYEKHEYKKWAKGLRKAGYATDPKYPEKLITTIEKYNLTQYDRIVEPLTFTTQKSNEINSNAIYVSSVTLRAKPRSFLFKSYKPGLFIENGATYAIPFKGESALAVAKRFGIQYNRLLKFNDLKEGDRLIDFQPLYIQPKKSSYKGAASYVLVTKDITMYEIAQFYGIKMSVLLAKNLMYEGEEPQNNEKIYLKGKAFSKPKLRSKNHDDILPEDYSGTKNIVLNTQRTTHSHIATIKNEVSRPESQKVEVNNPIYANDVYTIKMNTTKSTNMDCRNSSQTSSNLSNNQTPQTNFSSKPTNNDNNKTLKSIADTKSNPFSSDISMKKPFSHKQTINEKAIFKQNRVKNSSNSKALVSGSFVHCVNKGETLYSLHRLYLVSIEAIKRVNKLTTNSIAIGDKLIIPQKS